MPCAGPDRDPSFHTQPPPGADRDMIMATPLQRRPAIAGPCATFAERAHALLDGELGAPAAAALRAHAAACPPCARALEVERRFHDALHRRALLDQAPATLRDRVLALRHRIR